MRILHLNLKQQWWLDVKAGRKLEEYRLVNAYWKRRLVNQEYDLIYVKLGYPAKDDWSRILVFKWNGWIETEINHQEFNGKANVFAIDLTERVK